MKTSLVLASLLVTGGTLAALPTGPASGDPVSPRPVTARHAAAKWTGNLAAGIKVIPTAAENRTGYDRDLFSLWSDTDRDGCDTRDEVLIAEAKTKPTVGSGCTLTGGTWFSYYDGVTTTDPSTFDIDHLVPLAEAWDSGARSWDSATRERYANDLGDPRPLVAVSAASNRSKSDQDPAEWLPPVAGVRCRYVTDWVADKIRWSLSADPTEKAALKRFVRGCPTAAFSIRLATITKDGTGGGGSTTGAVKVKTVLYDPPGADTTANENDEYVVLRSAEKTVTVNLTGWQVKDAAGHTYRFAAGTLAPGATLTLRSGSGTDSTAAFHAGWGHVWNNSGDSVTVLRADASTSDSVTYPGGGDGRIDY